MKLARAVPVLLNTASHLSNYILHNDTIRNISKRLSQLPRRTSGSNNDRISHSPFKYDPGCSKKPHGPRLTTRANDLQRSSSPCPALTKMGFKNVSVVIDGRLFLGKYVLRLPNLSKVDF